MEYAASLFHITTKDEIYYGDSLNRNFDEETERKGIETDIKIYPIIPLYIWGNYTYTEARFTKGGAFIPLVPKHKASLGLELELFNNFLFSLNGTFTGSCFDGNDMKNNKYNKLGSYEVLDIKLTYKKQALKLFAGVNNVLDELYTTTAYSETYYPMPTRNFYGGVQWVF